MKPAYPWLHRVTAFISDEFPVFMRGDGSISSTMAAFIVGLVYGRCGPEGGHQHMRALDTIIRLSPREIGDKNAMCLAREYLITHGLYENPPGQARRKATSKAEKEQRLRDAGWTFRAPFTAFSRSYGTTFPPQWFAPGRTDTGPGCGLAQAWRSYIGETSSRRRICSR